MNYFYSFGTKDKILFVLGGSGAVLLFAYFFYRSLWAIPPLLPLLILYCRYAGHQVMRRKQEELRLQFKEVMELVSINLRAGYSVENAFVEIHREIGGICGPDSPMEKVLAFIKNGVDNNIPLERRIEEAGIRSGVKEIEEFAGVFEAAKHNGGNMIETAERTAVMIGEKIETEKEIAVLLTARKTEQRIMNIIPFFILLYLEITSPGYFQTLYHNPAGVVIMSICLAVYLLAFGLSVKMLSVAV